MPLIQWIIQNLNMGTPTVRPNIIVNLNGSAETALNLSYEANGSIIATGSALEQFIPRTIQETLAMYFSGTANVKLTNKFPLYPVVIPPSDVLPVLIQIYNNIINQLNEIETITIDPTVPPSYKAITIFESQCLPNTLTVVRSIIDTLAQMEPLQENTNGGIATFKPIDFLTTNNINQFQQNIYNLSQLIPFDLGGGMFYSIQKIHNTNIKFTVPNLPKLPTNLLETGSIYRIKVK